MTNDPTRKILWQLIHALGNSYNSPLSAKDTTDWLNELQEPEKKKKKAKKKKKKFRRC